MKIQKSCKPGEKSAPKVVKITNVKPGTVFLFGCDPTSLSGPFLRTYEGGVNLKMHNQYTTAQFGGEGELTNYQELPNAFLVTGEE